MHIPIWFLSITCLGVGTGLFFGFKYVLGLIRDDKITALKERVILRSEMKELRQELHTRMNSSETNLKDAIQDLTGSVVPFGHCNSKQEIWGERFENLVSTINTANDTRAKADSVAHTALSDTLLEVVTEVKQLKDCVTKLSNKREC